MVTIASALSSSSEAMIRLRSSLSGGALRGRGAAFFAFGLAVFLGALEACFLPLLGLAFLRPNASLLEGLFLCPNASLLEGLAFLCPLLGFFAFLRIRGVSPTWRQGIYHDRCVAPRAAR